MTETGDGEPGRWLWLARRSLAVIRANQAASGAYLASPNFRVYRFSWFRDGAFIADAMSRAGDIASAEAFFGWCARVITDRRDRIEGLLDRRHTDMPVETAELLHARYTVDGRETDEEWTDHQTDGYGAWLWALDAHRLRHGRPIEPYLDGAVLSARYAAGFWDHPCYDWWEERPDQVHTSTLAAIHGGLTAAAGWPQVDAVIRVELLSAAGAILRAVVADAKRLGHLAKWRGASATDASLISCATPFRLLAPDAPLMVATLRSIETDLVRDCGVHRYRADTYYGGGQWILLAALLGWHYVELGRIEDAQAQLRWIASRASEIGELPEQVPEHLLAPESLVPWESQWGLTAIPLLWSHAMYLTLALTLGVVDPEALRD